MSERQYYVYILTNQINGTLYIGVTNDLMRRVFQHKQRAGKGFTAKYGVDRLVYYEDTNSVEAAIKREKQLKWWERGWKVQLIEKHNSEWLDLYDEVVKGY